MESLFTPIERRIGILALAMLLACAVVPGRAFGQPILAIGLPALTGQPPIPVGYDPGSFGRRVTLTLIYRTTSGLEGACSDVDLDGVVLVLTLPPGTSLVSESDGRGVYTPTTGVVTWSFGTLDRLAHCFGGTPIDVTIDVDASVPDGTDLTASAVISTTTPGDDPSDNAAEATFQGGMRPLAVWFDGFGPRCDASAGFFTDDDNDGTTSCSAGDPGFLQPSASGRVSSQAPDSDTDMQVAELGVGDAVRLPSVGMSGSADGGFGGAPDGSFFFGLGAGVDTDALPNLSFFIENPNPFAVPLRIRRDIFASVACSDNAAGFPGDAVVEDSVPFVVECGVLGIRRSSGRLRADIEGLTGECVLSGRDTGGVISEVRPHGQCGGAIVPRANPFGPGAPGVLDVDIRLFGDASGDSNVFGGPPLTIIRSGYGRFNGKEAVVVAVGTAPSSGAGGRAVITGNSPIELRLTDAQGLQVGAGPAPALPDLGDEVDVQVPARPLLEIPGSGYSGRGTQPQEIVVDLAEPGDYALEVLGTGDGPFTVTIASLDADGNVVDETSFSGQASAGSARTEAFTLSEDGTIALVAPEVAGDLDGDGLVDAGDFGIFLSTYGLCDGMAGFIAEADYDSDGCVTLVDYQTWYGFFTAS